MYQMHYARSNDVLEAEFDQYGGLCLSLSWCNDESLVKLQWRDEEEPLHRNKSYEAHDWFGDEDNEYFEEEQDGGSWGIGSAASASLEMRRWPSLMDADSGASEQSNHLPMKVVRREKKLSILRAKPPPVPRVGTKIIDLGRDVLLNTKSDFKATESKVKAVWKERSETQSITVN
jgi:hypothetical protein